jgi:hypothetical protein
MLPKHIYGFGIGIIIGEPTGISLKFGNFPVLGIAWSLGNVLHINCDYWLHNTSLSEPFLWYVGVGGKILFGEVREGKNKVEGNEFGLGARIPVGIQVYLIKNKLELFGEIVPGILLIPSTGFDIDFGIGLRYHLNKI